MILDYHTCLLTVWADTFEDDGEDTSLLRASFLTIESGSDYYYGYAYGNGSGFGYANGYAYANGYGYGVGNGFGYDREV